MQTAGGVGKEGWVRWVQQVAPQRCAHLSASSALVASSSSRIWGVGGRGGGVGTRARSRGGRRSSPRTRQARAAALPAPPSPPSAPHLRLAHERARDRNALLLAAAQREPLLAALRIVAVGEGRHERVRVGEARRLLDLLLCVFLWG
jgi:hypothetical protein